HSHLAICCNYIVMLHTRSAFLLFSTYLPSTYIPTLSLHDALPIFHAAAIAFCIALSTHLSSVPNISATAGYPTRLSGKTSVISADRKSTRLNSSHVSISYAVFCLKKKIKHINKTQIMNRSHNNENS